MFLKMSFRNVLRNKKRNFLTLSVMVFGIAMAIFYDGIIRGYTYQALEVYRKTEFSSYKIYPKNYYENREDDEKIDYLMTEESVRELLINKEYSPRLSFEGTLTKGEFSIPISLLGVKKEKENDVFNREKDMVEGNFLADKNGLVIGSGIANELSLRIGDQVTLVSRTVEKSINAYDMIITGIIKSENTILNKKTVFINLEFAKLFLLTDKINDIALADEIKTNEFSKFKDFDLISIDEELKEIIALMGIKAKGATNSMLFVLIMAGVGIANTMLMAMLEREKEIGIMLANGMEPNDIKKLFILEGFMLGIIGSLVGLLLGFTIVLLTVKYGIPLPQKIYENMDLNMVIPDRMYGIIHVQTYFFYVLFGTFLASIASLYAAFKGSKIEPLDVLRD